MARRLALAVLAAFAVATVQLTAPWAQATAPRSHQSTFRFSGRLDCGSFVDRYTDRYWVKGRTHYGRSGKAVRTIDHVRHTSTERNSKTGQILHQRDRYTIQTDLRTGVVRVSGGLFRINRLGHGMVIHDVGRVVMNRQGHVVFTAGRHDVIGKHDAVFCSAFS